MNARTLCILCVAAVVSFSALLTSQSRNLKRDLEFIRGLVRDLQFNDLAQFELEKLKKSYRGSDDFQRVAVVDVEIALEGARRHRKREERRRLYKEALQRSRLLVQRYGDEPVATEVRFLLVTAAVEYGGLLNEELQIARAQSSAAVAGLERDAAVVFRDGVATANVLMKGAESKTKDVRRFLAWMHKGIMLREHGRAVLADRVTLCGMAQDTLEALIFAVDEDTALGQRALFEMAQVDEVLGDKQAAAETYRATTVQILDSLRGVDLPDAVQRLMFDMLQETYGRLAMIYHESGQSTRVTGVLQEYRRVLAEFRADPHPRHGDTLFLTEATMLAESGKRQAVTNALAIAKRVNRAHPQDYVGLKAKMLIDTILSRSRDLVTGTDLFEIAKGYYQERRFDIAIARCKDALQGMSEVEKQRLALRAWDLMGRSNTFLGRNLEATLCHARALDEHIAQADDADARRIVAGRMSRAWARTMREAGEVPELQPVKKKVDRLLGLHDPRTGITRHYQEALGLAGQRKWRQAAAAFAKIPWTFPRYEFAMAHRIDCLVRLPDYTAAARAIKNHRAWLESPQAEFGDDASVRQQVRRQTVAIMDLAEVRMHFKLAVPPRREACKPDLSKVPVAARLLIGWEKKHGKRAAQQALRGVHAMLGELALTTGDVGRAVARYQKLQRLPDDAHARLGFLISRYYGRKVKAAETQREAIALQQARTALVDFGRNYSDTLAAPRYSVLFVSMSAAAALRRWKDCEHFAVRALKLYGKDPRWSKDKTYIRIKPMLGRALLQQHKLQRALDMLAAARDGLRVAGKQRTAGYFDLVRLAALAKGGWPALDTAGNYRPVKGLGQSAEAFADYFADKKVHQYFCGRRVGAYSLGWYRYYLETLYLARQAARRDTKWKARADTLYRIARSTDDFATLLRLGQPGRDYHHMFQMLRR